MLHDIYAHIGKVKSEGLFIVFHRCSCKWCGCAVALQVSIWLCVHGDLRVAFLN